MFLRLFFVFALLTVPAVVPVAAKDWRDAFDLAASDVPQDLHRVMRTLFQAMGPQEPTCETFVRGMKVVESKSDNDHKRFYAFALFNGLWFVRAPDGKRHCPLPAEMVRSAVNWSAYAHKQAYRTAEVNYAREYFAETLGPDYLRILARKQFAPAQEWLMVHHLACSQEGPSGAALAKAWIAETKDKGQLLDENSFDLLGPMTHCDKLKVDLVDALAWGLVADKAFHQKPWHTFSEQGENVFMKIFTIMQGTVWRKNNFERMKNMTPEQRAAQYEQIKETYKAQYEATPAYFFKTMIPALRKVLSSEEVSQAEARAAEYAKLPIQPWL